MFDKAEWQRQYRRTKRGKEVDRRYAKSKKCGLIKGKYQRSAKGKVSQRRYASSEKGKATQRRYYTSEKGRENNAHHRFKDPIKYRAWTAVSNAIRDGRLQKRPCRVCKSPKSHAHHDDYTKPLKVKWFCAKHHKAYHRKKGKGANIKTKQIRRR